MIEHEKQETINELFIFEKEPQSGWRKFTSGISRLTSPLLFAGGFLSAYILYNHSNFFNLITSFSFYAHIVELIIAAIAIAGVSRGWNLLHTKPHTKQDNSRGSIHFTGGLATLFINFVLFLLTNSLF